MNDCPRLRCDRESKVDERKQGVPEDSVANSGELSQTSLMWQIEKPNDRWKHRTSQ